MAPKLCVFQTNHVNEPVVVQNRLYFTQSIYLHWGDMWPGCVWVPAGVNSVAVGQCWWSAQCRPAVIVLLCVSDEQVSAVWLDTGASRTLLLYTPASCQRRYSSGLQPQNKPILDHRPTRDGRFQWPVKKDLSEMKPHISPNASLSYVLIFTHLSCTVLHPLCSSRRSITPCIQHRSNMLQRQRSMVL